MNQESINTDKEIWRKTPDDHYSPSIHITINGDLGISVGGYVLVAPVEEWHKAGIEVFTVKPILKKYLKKGNWLQRLLRR